MSPSVSIVRCRSYDEEEVMKGLRQSIDLIGGIGAFVKRGSRVLLKPNLLYGKASNRAVTTHPAIVRGVVRMVKEVGGKPFIGDSPAIGSLIKAADKAGIRAVAEETGCPLIEFDHPVVPKERKDTFFKQIEIDEAVLDADAIINLPKWKTHGMTLLTLGIKNLFGCVPGRKKALWHLKAGEDRRLFSRMLVDLYQLIRPSLTILDGVVAMEGNGPASGNPVPLGLILAGDDALSVDQRVCDILGIPRKSVMTNRAAFESGMGREEMNSFGERLDQIRISGFKYPPMSRTDWGLPGFLRRALKNALGTRPMIEKEMCGACNRCVEICPPKALKKHEEEFVFNYGTCIRCFCCQEVCPEGAISIEPGWMLRMYGSKVKSEK